MREILPSLWEPLVQVNRHCFDYFAGSRNGCFVLSLVAIVLAKRIREISAYALISE